MVDAQGHQRAFRSVVFDMAGRQNGCVRPLCLMPQPPSGRDTANPPLEPNPARHERRVDSGYASDGSDGSMPSLVDG